MRAFSYGIAIVMSVLGCTKTSPPEYDHVARARSPGRGAMKLEAANVAPATPGPFMVDSGATPGPGGIITESAAPMIIRTGQASIEVDSVDRAVAQVRELARSLGGYVANTSAANGENNTKSATLQVKVPAEKFDNALSGLQPLGKLESVNVEAQDVGEEYVDVQSRVTNSRRLEERLITLLATRTGKLKDVLDVEEQLARVRGDIEHAEGRLRYLKAHASVSTLDVTVHEHSPVLAEAPGEHPLRDALRQARRNFVGVIAVGIASLGALVPLGLLGTVIWLGVRRFRRAGAIPS
jgi:Domain of unknown function (DUF4349)